MPWWDTRALPVATHQLDVVYRVHGGILASSVEPRESWEREMTKRCVVATASSDLHSCWCHPGRPLRQSHFTSTTHQPSHSWPAHTTRSAALHYTRYLQLNKNMQSYPPRRRLTIHDARRLWTLLLPAELRQARWQPTSRARPRSLQTPGATWPGTLIQHAGSRR